jgi:hypothetical protein
MSRITGNDALGLYEAYQSVYAPQEELTEEQVWEEVEAWATSLVEEGYDLSEYTWEDMYEAYIEERRGAAAGLANRNVIAPAAKPQIAGGGMGGMRGTGRYRSSTQTSSSPGALRVGANAPSAAKPAPAPAAKPSAPTPSAAKPAPTAAAKPAPSAAKPAPTAPAAPAAPAAPKKTFNPLMQKTFGYQTGYAPDQIKNNPKKLAQMGSLKSISDSFDMFDVVKEYLLGEGYADTEEAAVAIMANMSEDWKYHIIDEARAEGVKPYRGTATQAEVRKDAKEARKKHVEKAKGQKGYGEDEKFSNWKDKATPSSTLKRKGGETETVSQRMDREKPYGKRMTGPMAREYGSRHAAEVTRVVKGAGEPQAVTYPRKGRDEKPKSSKEIIRKG